METQQDENRTAKYPYAVPTIHSEPRDKSGLHDQTKAGVHDKQYIPPPATNQTVIIGGVDSNAPPIPEDHRLIRIHVIEGQVLKTYSDPRTPSTRVEICSDVSAFTRTLTDTTSPVWDEQFVIEHNRKDKRNDFVIKMWHTNSKKEHLIGEWEYPVSSHHHLNNWPASETLSSDKAKLIVRMRREQKREGTVHIKLRTLTLSTPLRETHCYIEFDGAQTMCTPKQSIQSIPHDDNSGTRSEFGGEYTFNVNHINNVRDFFVCVVQGSTIVGRARLILHDIAHGIVNGNQTLLNADRISIGTVDVEAEFKKK